MDSNGFNAMLLWDGRACKQRQLRAPFAWLTLHEQHNISACHPIIPSFHKSQEEWDSAHMDGRSSPHHPCCKQHYPATNR
eukprot:1146218-Pelagomonas_calceolata.AAC.4